MTRQDYIKDFLSSLMIHHDQLEWVGNSDSLDRTSYRSEIGGYQIELTGPGLTDPYVYLTLKDTHSGDYDDARSDEYPEVKNLFLKMKDVVSDLKAKSLWGSAMTTLTKFNTEPKKSSTECWRQCD